jgi:hypothetical protein
LGKTHDDILFDTFKSLLTTVNEEFETFINGLKSEWETQSGEGKNLTHDILVSKSVAKYNNLVAQKTWNNSQSKNAKLVALSTQVKDLQQKLKSNGGQTGGTGGAKKYPIAEWRLKKSFGAEVEKDGKKWYWCHHQHNDGKSMYVTHKPEDHTSWKDRKNTNRNKKSNGNGGDPSNNNLQLDDKLKAALVSKFKCSEVEAKNLMDSVQSGN